MALPSAKRFRRRSYNLEQVNQKATVIPKVLESPFVLWLLSAIFISLGSWAYSLWDASRKDKAEMLTRIARLDDEIQYRFTRANLFVKFRTLDPKQSAPALSSEHQAGVQAFARRMMKAQDKSDALFTELADRGLTSLLRELELLLVKANELAPGSAAVLRSSVGCVSQVSALLSTLDNVEEASLFTIPEVRARALVASAYRWGFRGSLSWTQALKQNQTTKEDVERLVAYANDQTKGQSCNSPTMQAMMNDAKELTDVGNAPP